MRPKMLSVMIPVLCCVSLSVSLNIKPVFGETSEIMNILNDMRNELDNVKLVNKRYGERIVRLEKEVIERNMKYTELTKKESAKAGIIKQLTDIEHQMEANYKNVIERLDALETPFATEHGRINSDVGESTVENEIHVDVDPEKDSSELELTGTKERQFSINKRIIPVTRHHGIAFTAFLRIPNNAPLDPHGPQRSQFQLQVPAGAILPFDIVELNVGQGFDTTTRVFTCPVSGVYYFSHSIATDSRIVTEIVKDGSPLARLLSWGQLNHGTHPVLTICNEGDEVFVRMSNENREDMLEFEHFLHDCQTCNVDKLISFTGFLLW